VRRRGRDVSGDEKEDGACVGDLIVVSHEANKQTFSPAGSVVSWLSAAEGRQGLQASTTSYAHCRPARYDRATPRRKDDEGEAKEKDEEEHFSEEEDHRDVDVRHFRVLPFSIPVLALTDSLSLALSLAGKLGTPLTQNAECTAPPFFLPPAFMSMRR